jgi:hypothetical protein
LNVTTATARPAPPDLDPADIVAIIPDGNDVTTAGRPPVDRTPDEVRAAQPNIALRDAEQTVGMASVNRSANAAWNALGGIIEGNDTPTVRFLDALAAVMVIAVVALGLIKFLLRGAYAKRISAFAAMDRSQRPPDYPPIRLSPPLSRPQNQVESNTGAASSLDESVKKALDTIEEAVAEMAPSAPIAVVK